ncbi:uncharacterized protein N7484_000409 [Penicillium longicatenatum]|uniref:uncharacterized protein n=1 Tax=Penicillium longicatenatum TaxID=1561947 RepID=UPI0025466978|nr:uncharacterized protein N7484_000409 [Penicillium longicatenatum]KAJ5661037.1 hypothetical protein N7484_000409 [Penicillium longicatenatum]
MSSSAGPVAGAWVAAGIATVILILRFVAKTRIHHVRADDFVMLLALVLAIIATVLLTVAVHYGFGKSSANIGLAHQIEVMKFATVLQAFLIVATGVGRCAFILYLLGIVGTERKHWLILWFFIALQIIINGISVILMFTQCPDIRALWNPEYSTGCLPASVQRDYAVVQTCKACLDQAIKKPANISPRSSPALNSFTDLYLAVFPLFKFWSLNLRLPVKISLIFLLSLGLLAMFASIGRTIELSKLESFTDGTRQLVPLAGWTIAECYLIIITGSLPCLRSLRRTSYAIEVTD